MSQRIDLGVNGGPAMDAMGIEGPGGTKIQVSEAQALDLLTLCSLAAVLGPRLAGPMMLLASKTNSGNQILSLARERGLTGADLKDAQEFASRLNQAEQKLIPILKATSRQSFMEMDNLAQGLASRGYEITYWAPLYRGALYVERNQPVPVEEDILTVVLNTRKPTNASGSFVMPKAVIDLTKLTTVTGSEVLKQFIVIYERLRKPVLEPLAGGAKLEILGGLHLGIAPAVVAALYYAMGAVVKTLVVIIGVLIIWFSFTNAVAIAIPELASVLKEMTRTVLAELAEGIKWLLILGGIGLGVGTILMAPAIIEKFEATYLKKAHIPSPARGTVPVPMATGRAAAALPTF